jgi:hypothetical protein
MADKNGISGMVRKEAVDAGEMAEENWTSGIVRKEVLDAGEMKGNVREPEGDAKEPARLAKERRGTTIALFYCSLAFG